MIHHTALVGSPPEHRDHEGRGIDPNVAGSARLEAYVTVDAGCFRATRIGERSWLMKKVHVGHDAIVGDDCEIAPLSSIGGEVELGKRVKVGQGATFKPGVKVGDDARVGMGAVVTKDIPAGVTVVGNPAKPLLKAAVEPSTMDSQETVRGRIADYYGAGSHREAAFDPQNLEREVLETLGGAE